jgi:hypothetical protein
MQIRTNYVKFEGQESLAGPEAETKWMALSAEDRNQSVSFQLHSLIFFNLAFEASNIFPFSYSYKKLENQVKHQALLNLQKSQRKARIIRDGWLRNQTIAFVQRYLFLSMFAEFFK